MNGFRSLILGSVVLCLIGLGVQAGGGAKKPQELIIGKWYMEKKEKKGDKELAVSTTMEFFKDGKSKATKKFGEPINKEKSQEGTYKFLDDSTLEVMGTGDKKTEKYKIDALTEEKLIITSEKDSKGVSITSEYKRVK